MQVHRKYTRIWHWVYALNASVAALDLYQLQGVHLHWKSPEVDCAESHQEDGKDEEGEGIEM